ncbi:MAG TPA: sulfite exporter TauE/SafE family protein [Gemmatimonadaceae bacterium]
MTLLAGILLASLLGSIHCAGMCGPFTCVYAGPRGGPTRLGTHAAYNGGRLVSYVLLGAIAGSIGARVDDLGRFAGVAHLAAIVAGCLMVAWAAATIGATLGIRIPFSLAPEWARRAVGGVLVSASHQRDELRALLVGLLTTLLPCGWLYTFVVAAGSTGSAAAGASAMAVFWIGTVPMLLAIGVGAGHLVGPLARRLPVVGATFVLVIGLLTIAGRLHAPAAMSHMSHVPSHGHLAR